MCVPPFAPSSWRSSELIRMRFADASSGDTTQCLLGIFGVDQRDADGNAVAIIGGLFLKVRPPGSNLAGTSS